MPGEIPEADAITLLDVLDFSGIDRPLLAEFERAALGDSGVVTPGDIRRQAFEYHDRTFEIGSFVRENRRFDCSRQPCLTRFQDSMKQLATGIGHLNNGLAPVAGIGLGFDVPTCFEPFELLRDTLRRDVLGNRQTRGSCGRVRIEIAQNRNLRYGKIGNVPTRISQSGAQFAHRCRQPHCLIVSLVVV